VAFTEERHAIRIAILWAHEHDGDVWRAADGRVRLLFPVKGRDTVAVREKLDRRHRRDAD
jgi:hypothetical protein